MRVRDVLPVVLFFSCYLQLASSQSFSRLLEPPIGQRCRGRNFGDRRCCTPERPCDLGEGDCDGPGDGGGHDGHMGCKGDLQCGSNNCLQFGAYYHEKDDCCERPDFRPVSPTRPVSGLHERPPVGQRCNGRNFGGRRCCTPQQPCNEGEGDCDGPGDGGGHDGHTGCKGNLVCGSNNCKKFGAFFHEKDDCCERPHTPAHRPPHTPAHQPPHIHSGWGEWGPWSPCTRSCGGGERTRTRYCRGSSCRHSMQSQDRFCNTQPCPSHWGQPASHWEQPTTPHWAQWQGK